MEVATEDAAPAVSQVETSQTESSQEQKVEKVENGTVESSVNETKTVTQNVESNGDQTVQTVVEEVKKEVSSSSVVVAAQPAETQKAPLPVSEDVVASSPSLPQTAVQSAPAPAAETPPPAVVAAAVPVVAAPAPVEEEEEYEEVEEEIEEDEEVVTMAAPVVTVKLPAVSQVAQASTVPEPKAAAPVQQEAPAPEVKPAAPIIQAAPIPVVQAAATPVVEAPKPVPIVAQAVVEKTLEAPVEQKPVAPVVKAVEQPPPVVKETQPIAPAVEQEGTAIDSAIKPLGTFAPPEVLSNGNKEIQQENIKQQLNQIITEIENAHINDPNANDERLDGKQGFDLQKIFTPATDVDEILPGTNRKLFASSSFYSPNIHPTVEDQVELARRISHSLSDISNQQSKGQSMYSNRKKRSVKWIHDDGREEERFIEDTQENGFEQYGQNGGSIEPKKVPLKLVMDPRHVQDAQSMKQFGYEPTPMSPEYGHELVNALNTSNTKGAELFAKRRKKAEKWVVDQQAPQTHTPVPASNLVAYTDAGNQRIQQNIMMDQMQEKYQQPRVQMVRSPWEAALETGSANNAFTSYDQQQQQQQIYSASSGPIQQYDYGTTSSSTKKDIHYNMTARDLAYRPNVPQGWQRPIALSTGMYTPSEIPVGSTTTSSFSSEKYSSTTTSNFNEYSLPQQTAPLSFTQAPAPVVQAPFKPAPQKQGYQGVQQQQGYQGVQQQQFKSSVQQTQEKLYKSSSQSFVTKPQTPVVKTPPSISPAPFKQQGLSPRSDAIFPRSGYNASPVTPGIMKKHIQLDAAVPVPPGLGVPPQSPVPCGGRSGGKSPVPFYNTAPAPFGFPAGSVQTPETIAQVAPPQTPLVPHLQNPKPLPLVFSTPLPSYSSSYNNAARPFNEFKDYYRPINMDSVHHKLLPPVIYTDF